MPLALLILGNRREADRLGSLLHSWGLRPVWVAEPELAIEQAGRESADLMIFDARLAPDGAYGDPWAPIRCGRGLAGTALIPLGEHRQARRGLKVGPSFPIAMPWDESKVRDAITLARAWRDKLQNDRRVAEATIEFQSTTHHLFEATELLLNLIGSTSLPEDQTRQFRQAFLEMGQNAIEWGNRLDPSKRVRVEYRQFVDRLEVSIRDEGPGFNPRSLPHAACAEDPITHLDVRQNLGLRDGGFGLLIVRGMVDDLRYNEAGNEVLLVRHFPPPAHPHALRLTQKVAGS
ncbi:MAG: ATP-binding protein [Isosphaeraceae bacterium]